MSIRYLPDSPPVFDTAKARARWAAAKADYLAGAGGPEVCERHGLSLSTFRWRAKQEGWRRADQPAPFIAPPEPELEPEPPQNAPDPLSSPPQRSEEQGSEAPLPAPAPPLTATQMVDTAWSHVQAAFAAGRLIEARGWMRLYKDLQPIAREEQEAERRARMDQEAAERPDPPAPAQGGGLSSRSLSTLAAEVAALARMSSDPRAKDAVRLQLDCFSGSESNTAAEPDP